MPRKPLLTRTQVAHFVALLTMHFDLDIETFLKYIKIMAKQSDFVPEKDEGKRSTGTGD